MKAYEIWKAENAEMYQEIQAIAGAEEKLISFAEQIEDTKANAEFDAMVEEIAETFGWNDDDEEAQVITEEEETRDNVRTIRREARRMLNEAAEA